MGLVIGQAHCVEPRDSEHGVVVVSIMRRNLYSTREF
jgi:hypothetical protein